MYERLPTAVVLNLEASNKEIALSLLADVLFKEKKFPVNRFTYKQYWNGKSYFPPIVVKE